MNPATIAPRAMSMLRQGEKLAFGTAVVLLAGYLAYGAVFSDRKVAAIPEAPGKQAPLAAPRPVDLTRQVLEAYSTPPPTPSADSWMGSYPTRALVHEKPGEPAPEKTIPTLATPVPATVKAEPWKVTITFSLKKAAGKDVVDAPAASYVVERKEAGAGAWAALALKVDAGRLEFCDDSVEAGTSYLYKITAVAAEALPTPGRRSSEAIAVTTPGPWSFQVLSADPDKEEIFIKVIRHDRATGRPFEGNFIATTAEQGERRIGVDRDGVSLRTFTQDGKPLKISFDCGYDLESVKIVKGVGRRVTLVSRADPKAKIDLDQP